MKVKVDVPFDRNENGGGIMPYIKEDILSKSLTEIKLEVNIQNIFINIHLRSKKRLILRF